MCVCVSVCVCVCVCVFIYINIRVFEFIDAYTCRYTHINEHPYTYFQECCVDFCTSLFLAIQTLPYFEKNRYKIIGNIYSNNTKRQFIRSSKIYQVTVFYFGNDHGTC